MALVADRTDPQTGKREILGVGRLTRDASSNDAELGLLVDGQRQGTALGITFVSKPIDFARDERSSCIVAPVLSDNQAMAALGKTFSFQNKSGRRPSLLPGRSGSHAAALNAQLRSTFQHSFAMAQSSSAFSTSTRTFEVRVEIS